MSALHPDHGTPASSRRPGLLNPVMEPQQLTEAIKSCRSLEQLACLWQGHADVQNPSHVAAYLKQVAKLIAAAIPTSTCPDLSWQQSAMSAQLRQLLQQLLSPSNLQNCTHCSSKSIANIIWALAEARCAPDVVSCQLLLERFCEQPASAPHEISSVLWGVAKITKERAALISSARSKEQQAADAADLQSQQRVRGPGSSTSALDSGSGDSACGSGARPLLQYDQAHLLLQRLCQVQHCASVQMISNSLWCIGVLQQEHDWCVCTSSEEIQALATAFCAQFQEASTASVQALTRCLSQFATCCMNHAGDAWLRWQVPLLQQLLDYIRTQGIDLQPHSVTSILCDVVQIACLDLFLQQLLPHAEEGAGVHAPLHDAAASLPDPSTLMIEGASSSTCSPAAAVATSTTVDDGFKDLLMQLTTNGGPWDVSSAVVALAMLQPHLQHLGLQSGVAALCRMLSAEVSPCIDPELWSGLLAFTMQEEALQPANNASVDSGMALALLKRKDVVAQVMLQNRRSKPVLETPPASCGSSDICSSASDDDTVAKPADVGAVDLAPHSTSDTIQAHPQPGVGIGISEMEADAVTAGAPAHPGGTFLQSTGPEAGAAGGSTSYIPGWTLNRSGNSTSDGAVLAIPGRGDICRAPDVVPAPLTLLEETSTAGGQQDNEDVAARQLTHSIAYADSVFQLASIFSLHSNVMDMIHITACITRLSKVLGTSPSAAAQAAAAKLLPELDAKLLSVLPSANARGIANILWGYGRLRALPQLQLLPALVAAFLQQLPNAACRDSAVVLWSLSRLMEGHGEVTQTAVPQALLCRLGREALQQMATAARHASSTRSLQDHTRLLPPHEQTQQQGTFPVAQATRSQPPEGFEGQSQPSARDISNSLMALARLGFVPETAQVEAGNPHLPSTASTGPQQAAATAATQATVQAHLGVVAATVPHQLVPGAGSSSPVAVTAGASERSTSPLTLPVSQVTDVVEYLLAKVATAKTLDLQETATALKHFGLRDLHMRIMAAVMMHHGAPHTSSPASQVISLQGPQAPPAARSLRTGGASGVRLGGATRGQAGHVTLTSTARQRHPDLTPASQFVGVGGAPGQQPAGLPGWQFRDPGLVSQGSQLSYGSPTPRPAQILPTDVMTMVQPHQQHLYTFAAASRAPGLAGGAGSAGVAPYSVLQGAAVAEATCDSYDADLARRPSILPGGFTMQYAGSQQQQQATGMQQPQVCGLYSPLLQHAMMQQQEPQQSALGGYVMQPSPSSQQQGQPLMMGLPAFQQQVSAQTPPGLLGAGRAAAQRYVLQASSAGPPVLAPVTALAQQGVSQPAGQQQLLLHPVQQAYSAVGPDLTGLRHLTRVGASSSSSAMLMETTASVEHSIPGDTAAAARQRASPAQLQYPTRESEHAGGMYSQQQALPSGCQRHDMGSTFLQQPQQVATLCGVGGSSPPPAHQHVAAPLGSAVGTLVLDPSTGMYHLQQ